MFKFLSLFFCCVFSASCATTNTFRAVEWSNFDTTDSFVSNSFKLYINSNLLSQSGVPRAYYMLHGPVDPVLTNALRAVAGTNIYFVTNGSDLEISASITSTHGGTVTHTIGSTTTAT